MGRPSGQGDPLMITSSVSSLAQNRDRHFFSPTFTGLDHWPSEDIKPVQNISYQENADATPPGTEEGNSFFLIFFVTPLGASFQSVNDSATFGTESKDLWLITNPILRVIWFILLLLRRTELYPVDKWALGPHRCFLEQDKMFAQNADRGRTPVW